MSFDESYFLRFYQSSDMHPYVVAEAARLMTAITGFMDFAGAPLESVLDVGAGVGRFGEWLREHRPQVRVRSLDISDEACAKYGHERHDISEWRDEEQFDLVLCNGVLGYLDDDKCASAIENLAAMTRGLLYVAVITQEDVMAGVVDLENADWRGIHKRPTQFYLDRLRPSFSRLGLGLFCRRGAKVTLTALERVD